MSVKVCLFDNNGVYGSGKFAFDRNYVLHIMRQQSAIPAESLADILLIDGSRLFAQMNREWLDESIGTWPLQSKVRARGLAGLSLILT